MNKTSPAAIGLIALLLCLQYSCGNATNKAGDAATEGEKLARVQCASCHIFPEPALLDRQTWETGVLPKMAELMNLPDQANLRTTSSEDSTAMQGGEPISASNWEKIVAYYRSAAPEKLSEKRDSLAPVTMGLQHFSHFSFFGRFENPMTTLVYFDTVHRKMYFGDGNAGKVFETNAAFQVTDSFTTGPGATDIHPGQSTSIVSIGSITPSNIPRGKLEIVRRNAEPQTVIGSLRRPVQAVYADLNADNQEDIILAEFGFRQGALSWYENRGDSGFTRHALRALPGATRVEVHDFNKDGKPDIAALMAQGDEGVFIYYNEGNGKFREDKVLEFPSVYGSNYFQLFDFNQDGFMDIITTHGDNADYSIIFKPYHGIRIFYNDGKNRFAEKYFLPVYGAQKVIPADFDNDGDIDLASIAFYPNYDRAPEESFLYWENTGNNTYRRYTFPGYADGRWLTMDAGDIDGDGDKDIILGSALLPVGQVPQPLIQKWQQGRVSITVLQNTRVQK